MITNAQTHHWHRRLPPTNGDQLASASITREGYTAQDALGNLGLNHMYGRVQDAITGRFLSADPYITEPGLTQNYNRYSYVYNNPMSFTDPSGFEGSADCVQNPNDNDCYHVDVTPHGCSGFSCDDFYKIPIDFRPFDDETLRNLLTFTDNNGGGAGSLPPVPPPGRCKAGAKPDKVKAFAAASQMAKDWLKEEGESDRIYGPESIQAQQMLHAPGVESARAAYDKKWGGAADLFNAITGGAADMRGLNLTNWIGPFNTREFLSATFSGNATQHFVGSFRVDIYGNRDNSRTFVLTNNSSFTSFSAGTLPNWERGSVVPIMGNMRQTYTWTEPCQ